MNAPNRDLQRAYNENLSDYKDTIPHLFEHNAFIVLGNGIAARYGSLSSKYKHLREWKRLEEGDPGLIDMETLLKGICSKRAVLDIFENFILFDDSAGQQTRAHERRSTATRKSELHRLKECTPGKHACLPLADLIRLNYTAT